MSHYDANLIQTRLSEFKAEMLTWDGERTILFDADNTLYLFSTKGRSQESTDRMYNRGFFKNLPVFQEAPDVLLNLQRFGLKVGIMSTYMSDYGKSEKEESFAYHFPFVDKKNIILVPYGKSKTDYDLDYKHTILVDDYYANIMQWYIAGGISIKKSYSGKQRPVPVVTSLIDLFPVLHELNFI